MARTPPVERTAIRIVRFLGVLAIALAFCLLASIAWTAPTDWAIEAAGQPPICAVDSETCGQALGLMRAGKLFRDLPRDAGWRCLPHPNCRDPKVDCIRGYEC